MHRTRTMNPGLINVAAFQNRVAGGPDDLSVIEPPPGGRLEMLTVADETGIDMTDPAIRDSPIIWVALAVYGGIILLCAVIAISHWAKERHKPQ